MRLALLALALLPAGLLQAVEPAPSTARPRARDVGIAPGVLTPGPLNAISDVAGVRVGHVTLVEGDDVRTGVTAILPHSGNLFREKVPAAVVVGNGFGKLVGSTQVNELGQLETPILLTNTLAVWEAANALAAHTLALPGNEDAVSVNPLVGETNDGWLNDIRKASLLREHFLEALRSAREGPVAEGSVGAGTGTTAFGGKREIKGGIGTSSRRVPASAGRHTVGVLVQTNFGGVLVMDGVPVGEELGTHAFADAAGEARGGTESGSCMIVVATDAPLDANSLRRLAARALAGMARTGAGFSSGSGDYVVAFSTAPSLRMPHPGLQGPAPVLAPATLTALFQAAAEATEEAICNSVLKATTVRGFRGRESRALPIDALEKVFAKHGRAFGPRPGP
ncbi:MAG: P1 family peptidase [Thermoanaerobaculia bacterium]|nr:P1 family peptidase [Thermoanaerobaculia bacterium]